MGGCAGRDTRDTMTRLSGRIDTAEQGRRAGWRWGGRKRVAAGAGLGIYQKNHNYKNPMNERETGSVMGRDGGMSVERVEMVMAALRAGREVMDGVVERALGQLERLREVVGKEEAWGNGGVGRGDRGGRVRVFARADEGLRRRAAARLGGGVGVVEVVENGALDEVRGAWEHSKGDRFPLTGPPFPH